MSNVLLILSDRSIAASWIVLIAVLCRPLLKKAPKWVGMVLWGFVALRLLCPFSLQSVLSLMPASARPAVLPETENGLSVIGIVYGLGVCTMLAYFVGSYVRLRLQLREAVCIWRNLYSCDRIDMPFALGIFCPRIYLPSDMDHIDAHYAYLHEEAHIKRLDHIWKPLGFALLTVYWFNPILWLAYILLCKDIELACDEKVVKHMEFSDKKAYSQSIVNCSIKRKSVVACPLAFGGTTIKERVNHVLTYKKPTLVLLLASILFCSVFAACMLTDPKTATDITDIAESGSSEERTELRTEPPQSTAAQAPVRVKKYVSEYEKFADRNGMIYFYDRPVTEADAKEEPFSTRYTSMDNALPTESAEYLHTLLETRSFETDPTPYMFDGVISLGNDWDGRNTIFFSLEQKILYWKEASRSTVLTDDDLSFLLSFLTITAEMQIDGIETPLRIDIVEFREYVRFLCMPVNAKLPNIGSSMTLPEMREFLSSVDLTDATLCVRLAKNGVVNNIYADSAEIERLARLLGIRGTRDS